MNWGDLRSACHAVASERPEQIKQVLAQWQGDPVEALKYASSFELNLVTGWVGEMIGHRYSSNPLAVLGHQRTDGIHLDSGDLRGYVNVSGEDCMVINVPHEPTLYQQWALEHVRKPVLKTHWTPMFEPELQRDNVPVENLHEMNDLLWDLVNVHHPAFIAGDLSIRDWDAACHLVWVASRDFVYREAADAVRAVARGTAKSAAKAAASVEAWAKSDVKVCDSAFVRYGEHLQQWLIGRLGWNVDGLYQKSA